MKMSEAMETGMFAPCGINCTVCYSHLAMGKKGKHCQGCLNSDQGKPEHCRKCAIKACTVEKGLSHCYTCESFPCKRIKSLEKSYNQRYAASLVENSLWVKNHGMESFLAEEQKRWACPHCGGVISLHDAQCSECMAEFPREPRA